ncbi:hypothetical protein ACS8E2_04350 [Psychrobacter glaciei]|uniref:hypothetical protein n=1 Tax=Psychrobacter TaxID=497 RepID=UPI00070F6193|nr:hypothetical protein [Psychrobacter sp. P11G3]KRG32962.1 hypothetical protein AK824_10885 [Psychrobacter sp. P11G3]
MSLKQTLKKAKQIERQLEQQAQLERQNMTGVQHSLGTVKPRNYLALDPLLRKGGIHEKEDIDIVRKKRRRETKQQLRKTDWLSE